MRKFEGDKIWVDGGPMGNKAAGDAYEREILAIHDKIAGVQFGRVVLEIVSKTSNLIGILHGKKGAAPGARSLAGADAWADGFEISLPDGTKVRGTGKGGPATIILDPRGDLGGMPPDVTLVHELIHAWREANGRWKPTSMFDLVSLPAARELDGGDKANDPRAKFAKRFENWEEFLALVVEGVYASQQGAKSVRTAQNGPFASLFMAMNTPRQTPSPWNPVPLTDSQRFAELYRPAIIRIMSEELTLYKAMLAADAWFNPVRDLAGLHAYKASLPPVADITTPPGMFAGANSFSLNDFY